MVTLYKHSTFSAAIFSLESFTSVILLRQIALSLFLSMHYRFTSASSRTENIHHEQLQPIRLSNMDYGTPAFLLCKQGAKL